MNSTILSNDQIRVVFGPAPWERFPTAIPGGTASTPSFSKTGLPDLAGVEPGPPVFGCTSRDQSRLETAPTGPGTPAPTARYQLQRIEVFTPAGWRVVATGQTGAVPATDCQATRQANGDHVARLSASTTDRDVTEVVTLSAREPVVRRRHTCRFRAPGDSSVHPGLTVPADEHIRYTYPLQVYEQPLAGVPALRCDAAWAVPVPFHIWHTDDWLVIYGVDRTKSGGTLDFTPPDQVRTYLPDHTAQDLATFTAATHPPGKLTVTAGEELQIEEVIAAKLLRPGEVPLLEAYRLMASVLLRERRPALDWGRLADGIREYYRHCELWNPDALGPGRGWRSNLWVHTAGGTPMKLGDYSGFYDFGWSEGFGARGLNALTRHWQRTGRAELLPQVDEMTRNIECFRRPGDPVDAAAFYDRFHPPGSPTLLGKPSDGLADFMGMKYVWSHTLGHVGYQLLLLHEEAPWYPVAATRATWRATAESIARFLARRQRPDGDLQDAFNEADEEVNRKPHRIAARAAVCGLWARLGDVTGDGAYLERALRLARAVAPDIEQFAFYGQMLDTHIPGTDPKWEVTDAEGAVYALEGLLELFEHTPDPDVLRWAKHCAAYTALWTYAYDLPNGHRGVTRGGTCCRMPDFPLIFLGAAAQAVRPLCRFSELTGDSLYRQLAGEMIDCIGRYQWDAPGKPWHGGMIHALDQTCDRHWGPNREGAVDTGMTTGGSLMALEYWLAHP